MRLEYFEMIDCIQELCLKSGLIVCESQVPHVSPIFEGHFPSFPILPGVLITEAMAQASGYMGVLKSDFSRMSILLGIDNARFRTYVEPGQRLVVRSQSLHEGSGFEVFECEVMVNVTLIANAQIRLRMIPFDNKAALRDVMMRRIQQSLKTSGDHTREDCQSF